MGFGHRVAIVKRDLYNLGMGLGRHRGFPEEVKFVLLVYVMDEC